MVSFRFSGKKSMTRIGRIFTDTHYPCASVSSAQSVFYPMDNKPQRAQRTQIEVSILCALCVLCGRLIIFTAKDFDKTTHRKERKIMQQESLISCVTKIRYYLNNELRRTETNSGRVSSYGVRTSSVLFSVLRYFHAPTHECTPPALAFHSRSSRAGG